MYIKFLIASIIFAGICFACGYRVCWLRMDKKVRSYVNLNKILERNYQVLLGELVERRIITPPPGTVRNDGEGADGSEGSSGGSGAFAEHIERRFKGEV